MNKGTAYIAGAGDFTSKGLLPGGGDILVAADGGYDALMALGIRPHIVLGDMDSIIHAPRGTALLRFPSNKDQTDMALALCFARGQGYRRFKLYGATGGRLDHTLANFQALAGLARDGLHAQIIAPDIIAYALADGQLRFPLLRAGTLVSVFAIGGEAEGVTLKGLKYGLKNVRLSPFSPLGVSNEATGQPFSISVGGGTLIITIGISPA